MRRPAAGFILALATLYPSWAHADAADRLQPGQYQVEVRVELPHIQNLNMDKTSAVCTSPTPDHHGLTVLGDNNPLARCPISNVRRTGNLLTFSITCPGPNAAWASASYTLAPDSFRGRIEMNMGGKNMTMAEIQEGHRVGDCPPPP